MRIDFSGVTDLTPVPDGIYPATLTEKKVVPEAKSSGKPYVALTFTMQDDEYQGRKQWRNFSLQPQSLWALKQACVRMGADPESFSGEVDLEALLDGLIGSDCLLDIGTREFQGEKRNEVKAVLERDRPF